MRAVVMDALREVYDPCCADRGISIVDMGVVEDVRVDGGHVDVKVVWDPVWTMDRLSESAREKLAMPLEQLEPYRARRSAA